ncbi:hypothetical protein FOZ60_009376 [Perkinsus olseni]|uniref:Sorl1p n=1 Tax=Perkinsus olseni TaxID=32597 RepID=A0A7J6NHP6_PEROL|nr:hypothetical protein FOZ60_009376 [Perkinsus olseni]
MFGFAILAGAAAASIGVMASASSEVVPDGWCEDDHHVMIYENCYKNLISCHFLPTDGIKMIDYDAMMKGYWDFLISAQDLGTGEYSVFRASSSDDTDREVMINAKADSIASATTGFYTASIPPAYIWAAVDNEIRLYGTPETKDLQLGLGLGDYKVLEPASSDHTWTSINWYQNDDHPYLYAVDAKNNQVYQWDPISDGVETASKKLVAGNADGKAIDDDEHLYYPQGVQSMHGYIYISQLGNGEDSVNQYRVVKWEPSSTKREFKFNFKMNGRFGFLTYDEDGLLNTISYRYGDDAIYTQCAEVPDGDAVILGGGCGAYHDTNSFVNADDGVFGMSFYWGYTIWDYNADPDRFVFWPTPNVTCPTTTTTTTTTPSTTTTTTTPSTTTAAATTTEASPSTTSRGKKECSVGDEQCSSYIPGSYCKYWEVPQICSGSNMECSCDKVITTSTTTTGMMPTTSTAPPTTPFNCENGDAYCCSQYTGSYCKYWSYPSVCSGTNIPCSCDVQA